MEMKIGSNFEPILNCARALHFTLLRIDHISNIMSKYYIMSAILRRGIFTEDTIIFSSNAGETEIVKKFEFVIF